MTWPKVLSILLAFLAVGLTGCATADKPSEVPDDPYAKYVWPPPPDQARIRLSAILDERADVEGTTRLNKALIARRGATKYEHLDQPSGVAIDEKHRILVADVRFGAIVRFDREQGIMDVFGTTAKPRLQKPMGLAVTGEGTIYVADVGLGKVLAFDDEGSLLRVYGQEGELVNPVDCAVSPDGGRLFVSDSKSHQIVVFDILTAQKVDTIGERGTDPGTFNFPTGICFDPTSGELLVVDQINHRVQILEQDGTFVAEFGTLGTGFGNFVRPKDVVVDERGYIYVSDAAFGNVQIFNSDLELLTFVGSNGYGPGEFQLAGSVDARGDEFVIVDQSNKRVQIFRYLNEANPTN